MDAQRAPGPRSTELAELSSAAGTLFSTNAFTTAQRTSDLQKSKAYMDVLMDGEVRTDSFVNRCPITPILEQNRFETGKKTVIAEMRRYAKVFKSVMRSINPSKRIKSDDTSYSLQRLLELLLVDTPDATEEESTDVDDDVPDEDGVQSRLKDIQLPYDLPARERAYWESSDKTLEMRISFLGNLLDEIRKSQVIVEKNAEDYIAALKSALESVRDVNGLSVTRPVTKSVFSKEMDIKYDSYTRSLLGNTLVEIVEQSNLAMFKQVFFILKVDDVVSRLLYLTRKYKHGTTIDTKHIAENAHMHVRRCYVTHEEDGLRTRVYMDDFSDIPDTMGITMPFIQIHYKTTQGYRDITNFDPETAVQAKDMDFMIVLAKDDTDTKFVSLLDRNETPKTLYEFLTKNLGVEDVEDVEDVRNSEKYDDPIMFQKTKADPKTKYVLYSKNMSVNLATNLLQQINDTGDKKTNLDVLVDSATYQPFPHSLGDTHSFSKSENAVYSYVASFVTNAAEGGDFDVSSYGLDYRIDNSHFLNSSLVVESQFLEPTQLKLLHATYTEHLSDAGENPSHITTGMVAMEKALSGKVDFANLTGDTFIRTFIIQNILSATASEPAENEYAHEYNDHVWYSARVLFALKTILSQRLIDRRLKIMAYSTAHVLFTHACSIKRGKTVSRINTRIAATTNMFVGFEAALREYEHTTSLAELWSSRRVIHINLRKLAKLTLAEGRGVNVYNARLFVLALEVGGMLNTSLGTSNNVTVQEAYNTNIDIARFYDPYHLGELINTFHGDGAGEYASFAQLNDFIHRLFSVSKNDPSYLYTQLLNQEKHAKRVMTSGTSEEKKSLLNAASVGVYTEYELYGESHVTSVNNFGGMLATAKLGFPIPADFVSCTNINDKTLCMSTKIHPTHHTNARSLNWIVAGIPYDNRNHVNFSYPSFPHTLGNNKIVSGFSSALQLVFPELVSLLYENNTFKKELDDETTANPPRRLYASMYTQLQQLVMLTPGDKGVVSHPLLHTDDAQYMANLCVFPTPHSMAADNVDEWTTWLISQYKYALDRIYATLGQTTETAETKKEDEPVTITFMLGEAELGLVPHAREHAHYPKQPIRYIIQIVMLALRMSDIHKSNRPIRPSFVVCMNNVDTTLAKYNINKDYFSSGWGGLTRSGIMWENTDLTNHALQQTDAYNGHVRYKYIKLRKEFKYTEPSRINGDGAYAQLLRTIDTRTNDDSFSMATRNVGSSFAKIVDIYTNFSLPTVAKLLSDFLWFTSVVDSIHKYILVCTITAFDSFIHRLGADASLDFGGAVVKTASFMFNSLIQSVEHYDNFRSWLDNTGFPTICSEARPVLPFRESSILSAVQRLSKKLGAEIDDLKNKYDALLTQLAADGTYTSSVFKESAASFSIVFAEFHRHAKTYATSPKNYTTHAESTAESDKQFTRVHENSPVGAYHEYVKSELYRLCSRYFDASSQREIGATKAVLKMNVVYKHVSHFDRFLITATDMLKARILNRVGSILVSDVSVHIDAVLSVVSRQRFVVGTQIAARFGTTPVPTVLVASSGATVTQRFGAVDTSTDIARLLNEDVRAAIKDVGGRRAGAHVSADGFIEEIAEIYARRRDINPAGVEATELRVALALLLEQGMLKTVETLMRTLKYENYRNASPKKLSALAELVQGFVPTNSWKTTAAILSMLSILLVLYYGQSVSGPTQTPRTTLEAGVPRLPVAAYGTPALIRLIEDAVDVRGSLAGSAAPHTYQVTASTLEDTVFRQNRSAIFTHGGAQPVDAPSLARVPTKPSDIVSMHIASASRGSFGDIIYNTKQLSRHEMTRALATLYGPREMVQRPPGAAGALRMCPVPVLRLVVSHIMLSAGVDADIHFRAGVVENMLTYVVYTWYLTAGHADQNFRGLVMPAQSRIGGGIDIATLGLSVRPRPVLQQLEPVVVHSTTPVFLNETFLANVTGILKNERTFVLRAATPSAVDIPGDTADAANTTGLSQLVDAVQNLPDSVLEKIADVHQRLDTNARAFMSDLGIIAKSLLGVLANSQEAAPANELPTSQTNAANKQPASQAIASDDTAISLYNSETRNVSALATTDPQGNVNVYRNNCVLNDRTFTPMRCALIEKDAAVTENILSSRTEERESLLYAPHARPAPMFVSLLENLITKLVYEPPVSPMYESSVSQMYS